MRPGVPGSDCGTGVAAAPDFGAPGRVHRETRGPSPGGPLQSPLPPLPGLTPHAGTLTPTLWGVAPAPLPEGQQQAGDARSEPSTFVAEGLGKSPSLPPEALRLPLGAPAEVVSPALRPSPAPQGSTA